MKYTLLLLVTLIAAPAATLSDPVGDTYGVSRVQHDIISASAVATGGNTVFQVRFADPILPPWQEDAALSIFGFISIDLDRNPATGLPLTWDPQNPNTAAALGTELVVHFWSFDRFSNNSGIMAGMDQRTWTPFIVPITFNDTGFTLAIPFVGIGDSASFNYAMVFGNEMEPHDETNIATSTVPEPGSLLLTTAGLGLSALIVRLRRRGI